MDLLFGVGPFILLMVVVIWVVFRGLRQDTHGKDTGDVHDYGD